MKSAVVYLPIQCPSCKRTTGVPYTRLEIATLLHSSEPFSLFSPCHAVSWTATEEDRADLFAMLKPAKFSIADTSPFNSSFEVSGE